MAAAKRMLVRYRTKPDRTDENARRIAAVFVELEARQPAGLRYLALQLDDGSFVHVVDYAEGCAELSSFESFQVFRDGIGERCLEAPQTHGVTIIGDYRPPEG
ncbi:MAG TPA: hypothetical protein VGV37_25780 [Aliidongia sp.]|uniref:hypothetical protein n=1 Tax=Aliidongia sp. TaxID=1914230 RepID=UPI002DDD5148|nr:hypothetical protein [Aliidongia sp.]HEV2677968.1 hypothetical protein [Aliidongia sp.]